MTLRRRLQACVALITLAFLGCVGTVAGATKSIKVPTDASVDIEIISWLEFVPPTGLMPVTISVRNHSASAGKWDVSGEDSDYLSGNMKSRFTVTAPPGGETNTSLLVPVMPNYDSSTRGYKNVRLTIAGPGLKMSSFGSVITSVSSSSSSSSPSKATTPFTVLSEGFDGRFGTPWKSAVNREWNGAVVRTSACPADWRGFSSIAHFYMLEGEWQTLSPPQREALMAWVAQGGLMVIAATSDNQALTLPESFEPDLRHGLGMVQRIAASDVVKELSSVARKGELALDKAVKSRVSPKDSLRSLIPPLRLNSTLIFIFILVFGVVVGPVNLFWLAKGSRRPRLFWTTPLISCIGTGVLIGVMILQDGFGGTGARVSLGLVLPQQKQMTVVQEQFSKTGILLGGAFELPPNEVAWITPVPEIREVSTSSRGKVTHTEKRSYTVSGDQFKDGWYTSRTGQSHLVNSQRLTRGGIEVGGGDSPFVISSLNTPLRTFFYQDAQQRVWTAKAVPVGQRTALKASTANALLEWKNKTVKTKMSNLMRARIDRCVPLPDGWFFAEAAEPARVALPTLGSIRWNEDRAFVGGLCVPAVQP